MRQQNCIQSISSEFLFFSAQVKQKPKPSQLSETPAAGTHPGEHPRGRVNPPHQGQEPRTPGSHSQNNSTSEHPCRTGSLAAPDMGLELLLELSLCCGAIRDL